MTIICNKCKRAVELTPAEACRLEVGRLLSKCINCGEAYVYPAASFKLEDLGDLAMGRDS